VVTLQQALQLPYIWSEQIILENAEQPEGKKKRNFTITKGKMKRISMFLMVQTSN
jgi:hypothetical protein